MEVTKNTREIYLYEKQDKKCFYCHQLFIENGEFSRYYNLDHKIPTSQGGKDTIDNVVLSCHACNSLKGNATAEMFQELLAKIESGQLKVTKKQMSDYIKYLQLKSLFEPNI